MTCRNSSTDKLVRWRTRELPCALNVSVEILGHALLTEPIDPVQCDVTQRTAFARDVNDSINMVAEPLNASVQEMHMDRSRPWSCRAHACCYAMIALQRFDHV